MEGEALETKALNAGAQGLDSVLEEGETMEVAREGPGKVRCPRCCYGGGQEGRG